MPEDKTIEEAVKELRECLAYCKEANGRDDCKNCGLNQAIVDAVARIQNEAYERGREEAFGEATKILLGKIPSARHKG